MVRDAVTAARASGMPRHAVRARPVRSGRVHPSPSPSDPAYAAELAVAIEAAATASAIQVEHYERLEHIVKKSARDVVTEADHLSEDAIIATIRRSFPDDEVLAEERATRRRLRAEVRSMARVPARRSDDAHRIWVIDPLDGTVNYAAGIPHFCTSVGLVVGGQPTVGVVLDPMRGDLFSAVLRPGRPDG